MSEIKQINIVCQICKREIPEGTLFYQLQIAVEALKWFRENLGHYKAEEALQCISRKSPAAGLSENNMKENAL